MPITVSEESNALLTLTITDPYSFEDWQAALKPFLARQTPLRLLVDRRNASPPTREIVDRMVNFLASGAEHVKGWRVAVAAGSDAAYGVARMLELTAEARRAAPHPDLPQLGRRQTLADREPRVTALASSGRIAGINPASECPESPKIPGNVYRTRTAWRNYTTRTPSGCMPAFAS
jgi:hypothetical protein